MPQPRRLSALDRVFLDLDTAETPQQVGWVIRFDGEPPSLGELRSHVASRLGQLPRFRLRIGRSKRRLGGPEWTAANDFSLEYHVLQAAPAPPGDAAALTSLAGELLSQRLDRQRPLWRLWLVDQLDDGWAVIGHGHHALIDGIAAVEVAMRLLDPVPNHSGPGLRPLSPSIRPTAKKRRRPRLFRRRKRLIRNLLRGAQMLALHGPPTALDDPGSGARAIAMGSSGLRAIKLSARARGATTNDAFLAAVARALTAELRGHGDESSWTKVLMPFQLKADAGGRASGNEISAVTIQLPLGDQHSGSLFEQIVASTKAGKALGNSGVMALLARGAGFLPDPLRGPVTRWIYRCLRFNMIVSNLRGPVTDVGLLGRTVTSIHPFVPITQLQGLAIGAMSYRGQLWLGINANPELVDAAAFARRVEQAFEEFAALDPAVSA